MDKSFHKTRTNFLVLQYAFTNTVMRRSLKENVRKSHPPETIPRKESEVVRPIGR